MEKTSKNRNISVVIPSRATPLPLKNLLTCLKNQTFQDFEILIVCDRSFTTSERDHFQQEIYQDRKPEETDQKIRIFSHLNSDFNKDHEGGASYIRNFGIKNAKGSYIQLFDDDNEIDPQYLEHTLKLHQTYTQRYQKEVIITPTLMQRNTDKIQNQGFSDYNYRLARPKIHFLKPGQAYGEIKMFSGNGIFGKAELMQKTLYDETIARIAEDLDFIYSIREQGIPILVFRDLKVRHQEREKSILEQARIGTPKAAEQKIRNLFLRAQKHGNLYQKAIFIIRSSRGIAGRLSFKALWNARNNIPIIKAIRKGYREGRRSFIKTKKSEKNQHFSCN